MSVRVADVWSGCADVTATPSRSIAKAAQTSGKILVGVFYALLAVAFFVLFQAKGQLLGEISFLFGPLMKTLPIGLVLFELGRVLDYAD